MDRMITAAGSEVTASTYQYDGSGRRYRKIVGGLTTRHIWDGGDITYDDTGSTSSSRDYIHGAAAEGMIVSGALRERGERTRRRLATYNMGFSPATGGVTLAGTRTFDAYGNVVSGGMSVENPYGYSGEYRDGETGLVYLRARYYDPKTGRFTQEDMVREGTNYSNERGEVRQGEVHRAGGSSGGSSGESSSKSAPLPEKKEPPPTIIISPICSVRGSRGKLNKVHLAPLPYTSFFAASPQSGRLSRLSTGWLCLLFVSKVPTDLNNSPDPRRNKNTNLQKIPAGVIVG
jgi:RHS repeat-associated protein